MQANSFISYVNPVLFAFVFKQQQQPKNKIALDDYPAEKCTFGETGWTNDKVNVITAIMNQTGLVMDLEG